MHIALDFDGTITERPDFYLRLVEAWLLAGYDVHILTARLEKDREETTEMLRALGFGQVLADRAFAAIHMYPHHYPWPFPSAEIGALIKSEHATWKARMCIEHGIEVLYDDCAVNIAECRKSGIYAIHCPRLKTVL